MAIQQGHRVRHGALRVHVVNVERPKVVDVDIPREHGQLVVELLLVLAPVIPVLPPRDESLDIGEGRAVFPTSILELIWEGGKFQLPAKEIELAVRNGDSEWGFGHCR